MLLEHCAVIRNVVTMFLVWVENWILLGIRVCVCVRASERANQLLCFRTHIASAGIGLVGSCEYVMFINNSLTK
jgi:hypothetical protein